MTRRRWLVAAVAVVVVTIAIGASVVMLTRRERPEVPEPGVTATDVARAGRDGRSACAGFERALGLIRQNEPADDVLSTLGGAVADASDAADRDPAWRPLASGLQALEVALERDDPRAADLGVRVVRAACEERGDQR